MMMCLEDQRKNPAMEKATEEEQDVSISSQFSSELILQTILVILEVNGKKWSMVATYYRHMFRTVVHLEEDSI